MSYLDRDPDSAFYAPAGYRDADMEMAALEAEGNRLHRLWKSYTVDQRVALEADGTIEVPCTNRDTGEKYTVRVCYFADDREMGYSMDGERWHSSARKARLHAAA